jgi:alginate O-acetyltransferase complex protein AlgJ
MDDSSVNHSSTTGLRKRWLALTIAAAAIVLLPNLFYFFPLPAAGLAENRVLAAWPGTPKTFADASALPQKLDAFTQDNFPGRSQIIARLNYLRYLAGYSTTKNVIVGKDGWLFWDNGTHLAVGRGISRLTDGELKTFVAALNARLAFSKSKRTAFYLIFGPVQETIYPDKLPDWLPVRTQTTTEIDQILEAVSAARLDVIVDPREALIEARAAYNVYGPYDTHWNGNGAYIAYRELLTRIGRDFSDLAPLPQSAFTPAPSAVWPKGLALMLGIAGFVKDPAILYFEKPHALNRTEFLSEKQDWTAPQILETDSKSNRTLLLVRDSFATELIELLKPHFHRLILVHNQDGFFREDLIEKYHPDITVEEVIESGFRWAMN